MHSSSAADLGVHSERLHLLQRNMYTVAKMTVKFSTAWHGKHRAQAVQIYKTFRVHKVMLLHGLNSEWYEDHTIGHCWCAANPVSQLLMF